MIAAVAFFLPFTTVSPMEGVSAIQLMTGSSRPGLPIAPIWGFVALGSSLLGILESLASPTVPVAWLGGIGAGALVVFETTLRAVHRLGLGAPGTPSLGPGFHVAAADCEW